MVTARKWSLEAELSKLGDEFSVLECGELWHGGEAIAFVRSFLGKIVPKTPQEFPRVLSLPLSWFFFENISNRFHGARYLPIVLQKHRSEFSHLFAPFDGCNFEFVNS